jgi:nucleotide-binding universal stress UspA family protein
MQIYAPAGAVVREKALKIRHLQIPRVFLTVYTEQTPPDPKNPVTRGPPMAHLLAAVDLSDVTQAVVQEAELLAKALSADLTLLYVAEPNTDEFVGFQAGPPSVIADRADRLAHERDAVEKLAAEIRFRGIHTDAVVTEGATAETILRHADQLDPAMIILGSHGHGMLYHALMGSVGAAVVKDSTRPVLIVPDPRPERRA